MRTQPPWMDDESTDGMKRILFGILGVAVLATAAWWVGSGSGSEGAEQRRRNQGRDAADPVPVLVGSVVDSRGDPISNAVVAIDGEGGRERARTGSEGRFRFLELAPGSYQLDLRADGFVTPAPKPIRLSSFEIPPRAERDGPVELRLTLRRPGSIEGRVVAGSSAVRGASITLYYLHTEGFREGLGPFTRSNVVRSSSDGSFSIGRVAPGRLRLIVESQSHPTRQSREIFVEPGGAVEGLEIDLEPGGRLSGRIVDGDGEPVSGRVVLRSGLLQSERAARTDGTGAFRFEALPSGTYRLSARAEGYYSRGVSEIEVREEEPTRRTVTLAAGEGVFGSVVGPEGEPVSGAFVRVADGRGGVEWRRTNAQGRFEWADAPTRSWSARAFSPRHASSMSAAAEIGREARLSLGPGGHLEGRVVDSSGRPLEGASVGVASLMVPGPQPYDGRSIDASTTSEGGTFRLGPLRPGRYELRAEKESYASGTSARYTVESGETRQGVRVVLGRGGRVAGRVRSAADGEGLEGATVSLFDITSSSASRTVRTDERGEFELQRVPAGRRSLRVEHEKYLTRVVSGVRVPEGGSVQKVIELRRKENGERFGFRGIGASLRRTDKGVEIRRVIPGGGAEKNGLQKGDHIRAVDRQGVEDLPLSEIVQKIRGRAGEPVQLTVEREGRGRFTVEIERERVVVGGGGG